MLQQNLGSLWRRMGLPTRTQGLNSAESSPAKVWMLWQMLIEASVKGCGLSDAAKEWTSFFLLKTTE